MSDLAIIRDIRKPFPVDARDLHDRLEAARDFSTWIKDRIERFGFVENLDYAQREDLSSPDSGSSKARAQVRTQYSLTLEAAKMIAAIENSEPGRETLRYLVKIETAWNTPEMALVRGLQAAQEIMERQRTEIASLAADAGAARVIACAEGLKTFAEIGKTNGVGPRKIIDILLERRILFRNGHSILPFQEHIDAGRFVVREKTVDIKGSNRLYSQTYVTGKGEIWIAKQLFPASNEGRIA